MHSVVSLCVSVHTYIIDTIGCISDYQWLQREPKTNRLDFTQGRSGRSIKDRCIAFLHATGRDGAHCEYNVPPPKPPTLKFFLRETQWLSGETPLGMPLAEARKFNQYSKQILNVNVWPSSVVRAQPMAGGTKKLKISVPVCLSFGELEYFMREALYMQSSHAAIHLREPEGIYPLQPSDSITRSWGASSEFRPSVGLLHDRFFSPSPSLA